MEKNKTHKPVQHEELHPKDLVDWSFQYYEDDMSSDDDNSEVIVSRWIVRKKRKCLPIEKPDQQMVQDLIINTTQ